MKGNWKLQHGKLLVKLIANLSWKLILKMENILIGYKKLLKALIHLLEQILVKPTLSEISLMSISRKLKVLPENEDI